MTTRKALSICAIVAGCICALYILILLFAACGRKTETYPWEKASLWVCEDPYFELNLAGGPTKSCFEWENTKYEVVVRFGYGNTVTVFPASEDGVLGDGLFGGSWKYRGKKLVVKLYDDGEFFDGSYKELVFVPQK